MTLSERGVAMPEWPEKARRESARQPANEPGPVFILDAHEAAYGHRLLDRKYGLMKKAGSLFSKIMRRDRVVIAIQVA